MADQSLIDRIVEEVAPGRTAITARIKELNELISNPPRVEIDPVSVIWEHLGSGLDPMELVRKVADLRTLETGWNSFMDAAKVARELAQHEEQTLLAASRNPALSRLNEMVTVLANKVNRLQSDLVGIRTAEDAIARGGPTVDAWRKLQGLVNEYGEIRAAQRFFVTSGLSDQDLFEATRALWATGQVRDPLAVDPAWRDRRERLHQALVRIHRVTEHRGATELIKWAGRSVDAVGLPFKAAGNWWPSGPSTPVALLTICAKTTPWVPPLDDMLSAYAALNSAVDTDGLKDQGNIGWEAIFGAKLSAIAAYERYANTAR